MIKYLFYVSVLLSTASPQLFAMDSEEAKENSSTLARHAPQNEMKLIATSTPPVLSLYSKTRITDNKDQKNDTLNIYFKNAIPGLERKEFQNVEINSNTIPYIIPNPLEEPSETPSYVADLRITIFKGTKDIINGQDLPLHTAYEIIKKEISYSHELLNNPISIIVKGTVHPGGKITDGKWSPEGEPKYISTSLWCPMIDYTKEDLYLDFSRDCFKVKGNQ